jgi:hypothetical protein
LRIHHRDAEDRRHGQCGQPDFRSHHH